MELAAFFAILLLLVAGPVFVVNRDVLLSWQSSRRPALEPPLPFLIIPASDDTCDIRPAFMFQRSTEEAAEHAAEETVQATSAPALPAAQDGERAAAHPLNGRRRLHRRSRYDTPSDPEGSSVQVLDGVRWAELRAQGVFQKLPDEDVLDHNESLGHEPRARERSRPA